MSLLNGMPTVRPAPPSTFSAAMMAVTAFSIGFAIHLNYGMYAPWPLFWLLVGCLACLAAVAGPDLPAMTPPRGRRLLLPVLLGCIVTVEGVLLLTRPETRFADLAAGGVSVLLGLVTLLALGDVLPSGRLRRPRLILMLAAFLLAAVLMLRTRPLPMIDVFIFQHEAAAALLKGWNPYAIRYPNVYGPNTPFYGPGVVDANNNLTYGFPYPPLSALLVVPAQVLTGDLRYTQLVAIVASAAMMVYARPGRAAALAAAVFLLTPSVFYVLDSSWTEPLLIFTFSLAMFCACRYPKALPWVLGLFFATKQYTVLVVPLTVLLVGGFEHRRAWVALLVKAGLVCAAVTLPMALWNFREFFRAVVLWQLVQPFRNDALSFLVFIKLTTKHRPPLWTPFLAIVPAIVVALRRCARTPAGFAAGVTLTCLAFFSTNKQAFCNYYYFTVATACWAIAAGAGDEAVIADERPTRAAPVGAIIPSSGTPGEG